VTQVRGQKLKIFSSKGIGMDIFGATALAGVGSFLLLALTVVTALVHEAGHALAWTLAGAHVREVGYADPYGAALRIKVGELTIAFNPFTVFAYTLIEGSEEQLSPPSKLQRICVHGAGIGANILAAAIGLVFNDPFMHLFAVSSAVLAVQNILFQDGERIVAALSES
jgi:Peptidase family M50